MRDLRERQEKESEKLGRETTERDWREKESRYGAMTDGLSY